MSYRTQKIQDPSTPDSPWKYTDNAQLLFGGTFGGNKLGMASIGTMCSLRSAGVDSVDDYYGRRCIEIVFELYFVIAVT